MKYKVCMFALLISALAYTAHAAPRRFETAVPENTMCCINVDNMKMFYQKWQQHPVSEISKKESVARLFTALLEDTEDEAGALESEKSASQLFEEEMGIKPEKLPELFPGQWLMAFGEFDFQKSFADDSLSDASDIPYVMLMRHNGDIKTIRDMIYASADYDAQHDGTKNRIVKKTFQGATLLIEEVEKEGNNMVAGGYALADDALIMSFSEEMLEETLIRLKSRPADSFYESKRFARARDRVSGTDAYMYFHFEKMIQEMQDAVIKGFKEKTAAKNPDQGASPISLFSPDMLFTALNLGAFDGFFLGMNLDTERSDFSSGLLLNDRSKGLASLFQYEKGTLPRPAYISNDVPGVSINHFNLSEFFINLEGLVMQSVPVAGGMYQGYLSQIKSQSGVDIREGLISNLGSEMITVDVNPAGLSPDLSGQTPLAKLYAIKIKDRQSFELTLNGILSAFGGADRYEKSDYLGYAIYQFKSVPGDKSPGADSTFAYTVTDDAFLFSGDSAQALKTILARMKKPSSKTLWETKTVRSAVNGLPAGNVSFRYMDVNTITQALLDTLTMFSDKTGLKQSAADIAVLKKDMDFPYCLISQTYSEKDGIYNRAMLLKKEK